MQTIEYTHHDDAALDVLRTEGDPSVDAVIADLMADHDLRFVNQLLGKVKKNRDIADSGLPSPLKEWMLEEARLPPDVDEARMARAQQFFVNHAVPFSVMLAMPSLLECYSAARGVKVLHATDQLGYSGAAKRLGDTTQFVTGVMHPGSFEPDGPALPLILKVRLMHAASRHLLRRTGWDEEHFGVPINQEDALGTLLTFGHTPLHYMPRIGMQPSAQEKDDFLYFWRVVGKILGIRSDTIPQDTVEATRVASLIMKRNMSACPEGAEMAEALLNVYRGFFPKRFSGLINAVAYSVAGEDVCRTLAIPEPGPWSLASRGNQLIGKLFNKAQNQSAHVNHVVSKLGLKILALMEAQLTQGEHAAFEIPTELKRQWRLPPSGDAEQHTRVAKVHAKKLDEALSATDHHAFDIACLVAASDGDIDDLEHDLLLETWSSTFDEPEDVLDQRIDSTLKGIQDEGLDAHTDRVARWLRSAGCTHTALRLAVVVAYADKELAGAERRVIDRIAEQSKITPSEMDTLVRDVRQELGGA